MSLLTPLAWSQVQVEEHWSAYDYPKTIPEGVKYHIIEDGDTLWDLAGRYLSDPLLWPQIYQANDYIKDPNLIYPGDPLILDVGVVVDDTTIGESVTASEDPTGAEPGDTAPAGETDEFAELEEFEEAGEDMTDLDAEEGQAEEVGDVSEVTDYDLDSSEFVILPAGDRSDMECCTYLEPISSASEKVHPNAPRVFGGETKDKTSFSEGDVVYINQGSNHGIAPGAMFSTRRRMVDVYYPSDAMQRNILGAAVDQTGIVKIVAVQDENATALITASCFEVAFGDFLIPYEQEPIPLITEIPDVDRFKEFRKSGSGLIVNSEDGLGAFGKGHLAIIDLGTEASNIAPGDLFIIYRDNPQNNPRAGLNLPDIYLGHGVALKTMDTSTVMKVISGFQEMRVGDRVVPYIGSEMGE
ncbi:MAG: LysM domain-containing protein [Acidobacteriota bacterium]|nr:LysM domain-containing protein [Acidobacteriota bacterium]